MTQSISCGNVAVGFCMLFNLGWFRGYDLTPATLHRGHYTSAEKCPCVVPAVRGNGRLGDHVLADEILESLREYRLHIRANRWR